MISNPTSINRVSAGLDSHNSELHVILLVIAEVAFELLKNMCKDNDINKVISLNNVVWVLQVFDSKEFHRVRYWGRAMYNRHTSEQRKASF